MKIDKKRAVAFSGHRKLEPSLQMSLFGTGSDGDLRDELRKELRERLEKLYDEGYDSFICGMAEGFDLLAGEVVCEMKRDYEDILLLAAIPYSEQNKYFKDDEQQRYKTVLEQADAVRVLATYYSPDAFHFRNDYMVENSSVLVCFYNGSRGGTEYTVKKAIKSGSLVINLHR